jgi:glycosyltransferase involved in cell wall biosynthesis
MKICMFTNTYLPHVGGVARSVDFFARDLRSFGHRVLVVAPTFPEDMGAAEDNEWVLRVPAVQNFNGSDFSVRIPLPFVISQRIDDFKPDILHSHHPFLMGDTALRIARRRDLGLVFTHHTLYEQYTHYVPLDSKPLQDFVVHLATCYSNFCDQVVAPSRSVARLIRRRGVERPIEDIPTGVDLDFFTQGSGRRFRKIHRIPEDAFVVGHLGRLAPEKNLAYLAAAVADFVSRHRQSRFLVVGSGPSVAEIHRIFDQQYLDRQLIMPGRQSGPNLSDAYNAMDLFVFSSLSETQGMVLVEAMAAGKPVIALDASGVREVVADGINGRLLAENTPIRDFADAIEDFFKTAELADQWGRRALKTARNLSRTVCARRLEKLYRSVLAKRLARSEEQISDELIPWDSVLEGIKVEWKLLTEKTTAAVSALRSRELSDTE